MQTKRRTSVNGEIASEIVYGSPRGSNQKDFRAGLEPVNEPPRFAQTSRGRG
jgi:hypothetical protein